MKPDFVKTWIPAFAATTAFVVCTGGVHAAQSAPAANYPNKPLRWVIPFAPGGGTDVVARPIAQRMSERLGQPILYENRGGGGGIIAGEIVARATPDGYTLLVAAVAVMTVTPTLTKMPFDPHRDLVPITKFASVPNMLTARAAFAPRTVQEIVDYARANPGKVNWASSGTGSAGTLAMELFRMKNAIKVTHVPYKGAGPANVALLSNEADLLFANPGVFMAHIKAGRLKAIAVASTKRIAIMPDLPTMVESGYPGFESGSWYGLAAPARTSPKIVSFLHGEAVKVLAQPELIAHLANDGASPVANTPEQFTREIQEETAKWARVIKDAGIKM
ncbi:MAG TPA: tripartite tricarboxylate transporter substrate binding protein [Burkholderiales bacterium]|nr:tripartite tricarboxylate transporter substrate binding protein [Burkholderiales bacterium]